MPNLEDRAREIEEAVREHDARKRADAADVTGDLYTRQGIKGNISLGDQQSLSELIGERSTNTPEFAFIFNEIDAVKIRLSDGTPLLVEGSPELVDHLAILVTPVGVPAGVWSKSDPDNLGI